MPVEYSDLKPTITLTFCKAKFKNIIYTYLGAINVMKYGRISIYEDSTSKDDAN